MGSSRILKETMSKTRTPDPDLDVDLGEVDQRQEAEKLAVYLRECVRIDPSKVTEEFIRVPSDLAFWSERYNDAAEAYLRAKMTRDKCAAEVELRVRRDAAHRGEKLTENIVQARVTVDEEFTAMNLAVIEAEANKNRLRSTVDAILAKKDMLVSVGAHLRAEMGRDPVVREQAARNTLGDEPAPRRRGQ